MGKIYEEITDRLAGFIAEQPMFFVGTAPSGDDGHVNVSPKGMSGTFQVLGPHRVAYLDWGGSGVEGTAHLRQNGRICVMFCSFDRTPKILRLHGKAEPVFRADPRFGELITHFDNPELHGVRSIIDVAVTRVADSCGYAVPHMEYQGDRSMLIDTNARRTKAVMAQRRLKSNTVSVDGLPGLADSYGQDYYEALLEEPVAPA